MKKVFMFLFVLAVLLGFSMQAQAALQLLGTDSLGNRLIYDTDLNITWYDYSNRALTWDDQMAWADGLSVTFGSNVYDDWRLPTALNADGSGPCVGYNCTSSEMGHLYYTALGNLGYFATDGTYPQPGWGLTNTGPFQNLEDRNGFSYWSSTEFAPWTGSAWNFNTYYGGQGYFNKDGDGCSCYLAIAVRPGLAVVPEPISSTLFIIGAGVLAGRRYLRKK